MRPYLDIRADFDAPEPPIGDLGGWEAFCVRVTESEIADMHQHEAMTFVVETRGGIVSIPDMVATDPRLCADDRFVLAAMLSSEADTTQREARAAIGAQLFGEHVDCFDWMRIDAALARMVRCGVIARTSAGGFYRRAT